ncbi:CcdB family protein [Croceibacterium ferulae]|uniref:CcdB family protein n=1 Tax=Croceibacterium ferulae TaxID=1854641 RepID=UPI000EB479FB|nr:CcdB family protein [Croceibacterium ferulae]
MAKFDVYRMRQGGILVIDCQADLLSGLNTRLVVPLLARSDAPQPAARLNPTCTKCTWILPKVLSSRHLTAAS